MKYIDNIDIDLERGDWKCHARICTNFAITGLYRLSPEGHISLSDWSSEKGSSSDNVYDQATPQFSAQFESRCKRDVL